MFCVQLQCWMRLDFGADGVRDSRIWPKFLFYPVPSRIQQNSYFGASSAINTSSPSSSSSHLLHDYNPAVWSLFHLFSALPFFHNSLASFHSSTSSAFFNHSLFSALILLHHFPSARNSSQSFPNAPSHYPPLQHICSSPNNRRSYKFDLNCCRLHLKLQNVTRHVCPCRLYHM